MRQVSRKWLVGPTKGCELSECNSNSPCHGTVARQKGLFRHPIESGRLLFAPPQISTFGPKVKTHGEGQEKGIMWGKKGGRARL